MSTKNVKHWILAASLALGVMGIYGFKTMMGKNGQEICIEQGKEGQDKKADANMPMWESLSRHLIIESRN
jgi:hypothetical protein